MKLPPEIITALEQQEGKTEAVSFAKGFKAGQAFQHRQIERILCQYCSQDIPVLDLAGAQVHDVTIQDRVWRKSCDARIIHAFKI
jgi:hypothetical protein